MILNAPSTRQLGGELQADCDACANCRPPIPMPNALKIASKNSNLV
jgi:hypothetical protein